MKNLSGKRVGAATLALAFVLTIAPSVFAAQRPRERDPRDIRERIVRIIKKIHTIIGVLDDVDGTTPPKP